MNGNVGVPTLDRLEAWRRAQSGGTALQRSPGLSGPISPHTYPFFHKFIDSDKFGEIGSKHILIIGYEMNLLPADVGKSECILLHFRKTPG
jgi:hypothetical protein